MLEKIEMQKKMLIQERDAIIDKIKKNFDYEIKQLDARNEQILIKNKEGVPLEEIHNKINKIR